MLVNPTPLLVQTINNLVNNGGHTYSKSDTFINFCMFVKYYNPRLLKVITLQQIVKNLHNIIHFTSKNVLYTYLKMHILGGSSVTRAVY